MGCTQKELEGCSLQISAILTSNVLAKPRNGWTTARRIKPGVSCRGQGPIQDTRCSATRRLCCRCRIFVLRENEWKHAAQVSLSSNVSLDPGLQLLQEPTGATKRTLLWDRGARTHMALHLPGPHPSVLWGSSRGSGSSERHSSRCPAYDGSTVPCPLQCLGQGLKGYI